MNKYNVLVLGALSGLIDLCAAAPGHAGIAFTGLGVEQGYYQSASSTSFFGADLYLGLNAQSASDFTGATVLVPGNPTPLALPWTNTLESNGTYGNSFSSPLLGGTDPTTTLASLNATYPTGTYTFTATNGTTGFSQTATLDYDFSHWPTQPGLTSVAVPALTASSYSALQGMNPGSPLTLSFNSFTGDGFNPFDDGEIDPRTTFEIDDTAGNAIYIAPVMTDSTTLLQLPSGTLQPGTPYYYYLGFTNGLHCGGSLTCGTGNPYGYYLNFATYTVGSFTTLAAAPAGTTVADIAGGSLTDPTPLESEGRIGQVDGSIGGEGSEDFYRFYWAGGTFDANAQLYGVNPGAEYEFELLNDLGALIDSVTLDAANSYGADLSWDLPTGENYEIGLLADSSLDPGYSITFNTPVGSVPEPGTLGLLALGFLGLVVCRRGRARC